LASARDSFMKCYVWHRVWHWLMDTGKRAKNVFMSRKTRMENWQE